MQEFTYKVGEPGEDGNFLISGFGCANRLNDCCFRQFEKEFRFAIPGVCRGQLRITLRMKVSSTRDRLSIFASDSLVEQVSFKNTDWNEYCFVIDRDKTELAGPYIILKGMLDADPMLPPRVFACLGQVTVKSLNGYDLILTDEMTRARISQNPIKLTNCYRSYHEIRKLAHDFGPRCDKYVYSEEKKIFFGDIHIHSNYSPCGYPFNGSIDENAAIAREKGLDFIAFADHAEGMDFKTWDNYFKDISDAQEKYNILIIPAIEWTSFEFGHRNVYFMGQIPPFFSSRTFYTNSPGKLARYLADNKVEAFAAPHHTAYISHLTDVNTIEPGLERLIEIYSTWGSSEDYNAPLEDTPQTMPGCHVQYALAKGLKLGFIGGGDVHNTLPGAGGLTAVISGELSLEGIYTAMKNRLCYAVSNDKILLDFHINGFPMGSILKVNQYTVDKLFPLHVAASSICCNPVKKLELICNGEIIYTKILSENKTEMDFFLSIDKLSSPHRLNNTYGIHLVNCSRYYYIRVTQHDGSMAWSSPIWIDFEYTCD